MYLIDQYSKHQLVERIRKLEAEAMVREAKIAVLEQQVYWTDAAEREQLEAENARLREAINKALNLDSRSHTREGWKRDIVQAIEILKEALENATCQHSSAAGEHECQECGEALF